MPCRPLGGRWHRDAPQDTARPGLIARGPLAAASPSRDAGNSQSGAHRGDHSPRLLTRQNPVDPPHMDAATQKVNREGGLPGDLKTILGRSDLYNLHSSISDQRSVLYIQIKEK